MLAQAAKRKSPREGQTQHSIIACFKLDAVTRDAFRVTPDPLPLRDALDQSAPLARLRERMEGSRGRLAAIRGCLPAGIAEHVAAGPLDDESWALLTPNGSVAAKLRQLQPRLEAALRDAGWPACAIRIKVCS